MDENPTGAPGADEYRDMLRRLRVLIVGGGAIGQVFGTHLQAGGAEVSFFLKPRYEEDAREGWDIHQYGLAGLRPRKHLKPAEVFTDHRYLRTRTFDQIWLCVSSPALRSGMLEQLNDACPNAVWVSFQPGLEDREYLIQRVPGNKLVVGLVNYIAYQAPLQGEELWPAGIAYWVPPFTMAQFTGPEPYASAVANLLQTGGFKAGVRPDTLEMARYGSSVLLPFVVALECSAWSWSQLRANGALIDLMIQSITDTQTAIEKATGAFAGSFAMGQKPFAWKLALFAAPKIASFPIEEYFKHHFTKVREQSDQMVDDFAQLCRDNAIIPRALESLRDQWRVRRRPIEGQPNAASSNDEKTPMPSGVAASNATAPVSITGANPVVHTGANPAVLDAAPVAKQDVVEPTRPMSIDGLSGAGPAAEPSGPDSMRAPGAPIEVDFDFDGTDGEDELQVSGPLGPGEEGLEEPTDQSAQDDDDEVFVSEGAASHRRQLPELDVEMELEPLPEVEPAPAAAAPVLRTLADLDRIPAIQGPPEPKPEPVEKRAKPLPFAVADEESEPDPLPSIIIDAELETEEQPREAMQTIRDPEPGQVHFRDAVPKEQETDLRRQDFIQTEFANEQQNADLRNLKNRLRARLGSKKSMSPALDDED